MTTSVTLRLVKGQLDRAEDVFDERTTCVLGRAKECEPRLPDDDYHRTVSRHHCLLDINPPDARIRDFGSRNGTYVNGKKIGQREEHQTPEEGAAVIAIIEAALRSDHRGGRIIPDLNDEERAAIESHPRRRGR